MPVSKPWSPTHSHALLNMYQVGSALWVAIPAHVHLDSRLPACLSQML